MADQVTLIKDKFWRYGRFFMKLVENPKGYIFGAYSRQDAIYPDYFEVFEYRVKDGQVSYPRNEAFGKWAWTYKTMDKANAKLIEIINRKKGEKRSKSGI